MHALSISPTSPNYPRTIPPLLKHTKPIIYSLKTLASATEMITSLNHIPSPTAHSPLPSPPFKHTTKNTSPQSFLLQSFHIPSPTLNYTSLSTPHKILPSYSIHMVSFSCLHCVYLLVHVYTYFYIHVPVCTCVYLLVHVCTYFYIHVPVCTYMYLCVPICTCVYLLYLHVLTRISLLSLCHYFNLFEFLDSLFTQC